eukprot:CAMPEP_0170180552 /NCGR_PEP_ID=MMETSP0040_2-20121228/22260_1 /TAXON_ID=641309 /ORGANISM="Lotharella oceanica, Strain CCMP622" /LENGTH=370 /DNA_ID=CAMNT_0010425233 /DNA_START=83 /DNA_END=1195 /DNA_ORIENTATION=+
MELRERRREEGKETSMVAPDEPVCVSTTVECKGKDQLDGQLSPFGSDTPRAKNTSFFVSVGTFKKPLGIFRALGEAAMSKAKLGFVRTAIAGFMAGMYISAGGLFSVSVGGGMPEIAKTDPGVQRLAFAAVFPVGLLLCAVSGAELWTGNTVKMMTGILNGRVTVYDVVFNWSVAWTFNFFGSLFFAYFLVYLAGILDQQPYRTFITNLAESKIDLLPGQAILRGIGANWLVCLATTLGTSAQSVTGKMLGIWFPITAFVAIGYEHSVANMFLVPVGLMYGARGGFTARSFFEFIGLNLLPVTFGNLIGGAIFVSGLYHLYLGKIPFPTDGVGEVVKGKQGETDAPQKSKAGHVTVAVEKLQHDSRRYSS